VPVFVFQEGRDAEAERVFRDIARLSGGAWCPFDHQSPQVLKDLLSAVAVFAAGGRRALTDFGRGRGGAVLQLTRQMEQGSDGWARLRVPRLLRRRSPASPKATFTRGDAQATWAA
jgi:hypothetical protein